MRRHSEAIRLDKSLLNHIHVFLVYKCYVIGVLKHLNKSVSHPQKVLLIYGKLPFKNIVIVII